MYGVERQHEEVNLLYLKNRTKIEPPTKVLRDPMQDWVMEHEPTMYAVDDDGSLADLNEYNDESRTVCWDRDQELHGAGG
eukprot:COSAG01_NODE_2326_length_7903_cov_22.624552_10_plen_80_part_00